MADVCTTPLNVSASEGEVLIDGPCGMALSLSPDAAAETSDRLLKAAAEAHCHQIDKTAGRKW